MKKYVEIIKCDNCGEQYALFDTDPFISQIIHGVCLTCFMPMKVKNPFYKEAK